MKIQKASSNFSHLQYLQRFSMNTYMILDGARFTNVYKHIYEMDDSPNYEPLYKIGTYFEPLISVSPCVVKLKTSSTGFMPWFLSIEAREYAPILLISPSDLSEVSAHLAQFLIGILPDERKVLLRFYDPDIFKVIAQSKSTECFVKIMKIIKSIIWIERDTHFFIENNELGV